MALDFKKDKRMEIKKMIKETIKTERKEIGIEQVKEMLDNGASLKAELFDTGYCDDNYPVQEYRAVVKIQNNGEETTITMNMLDMITLVDLYRRK